MKEKHDIVDMSWQEAYPASSGIKCTKCGKCRLNWGVFNPTKFKRELSPGCKVLPEPKTGKAHNVGAQGPSPAR